MAIRNNNVRNLVTPDTKTIVFAKVIVPPVPEKVTDKEAWQKWQIDLQRAMDKYNEQLATVIGGNGAT